MVAVFCSPQVLIHHYEQKPVGADAHIGPLPGYEFALAAKQNETFYRRDDVGIVPYAFHNSDTA